MKQLIERYQSPTGYGLVQNATTFFVTSPCCDQELHTTPEYKILCANCETVLHKSTSWAASCKYEQWQNSAPSEATVAQWGEFWFGYKDFKLVLE